MPEIRYTHLFPYRPLLGHEEQPGFPNSFPAVVVRLVNQQDKERYRDVVAVIDSGARVSVFDPEIAIHLGLDLGQQESEDYLITTSGERVRVWYHSVDIQLGEALDLIKIQSCQVAFPETRLRRNLLGRPDFFHALQIGFNERAGEIYLEPMQE